MFQLDKLVRPNIRTLVPYSSAREEYTGQPGVFLDANENPFGTLNRYPDPYQVQLKEQISSLKNIPVANTFIGNGSDEIIDLLFRIFCIPGTDQALQFTPTYGMYKVSADINDVAVVQLPLDEHFQLTDSSVEEALSTPSLKLIFLCSPNNPTGNTLDKEKIEYLLKRFSGIIVIDEAYIDFSDQPSWITMLDQFPNLIVIQTLSKAWGLAGSRVGIAFAHTDIIALLNKVKPPYNIGTPNQQAALAGLQDPEWYTSQLATIKKEKERMREALSAFPSIIHIYPSDTNFLLVQVADAQRMYNSLIDEHIIVRNRHRQVPNCLRITIGTPEENDQLLQVIETLE